MSEDKKREPGRPANYGDATPEEVGKALVSYRPERKQKPANACPS